jgi:hypothetical protein
MLLPVSIEKFSETQRKARQLILLVVFLVNVRTFRSVQTVGYVQLSAFKTKLKAVGFCTGKRNALKSKIRNLRKCSIYHRDNSFKHHE